MSSKRTAAEPELEDRQRQQPSRPVVRLKHLGKAETVVLRDDDTMRAGLCVRLETIRAGTLEVVSPIPLRTNEQVKIRLRNEIQRITADLRGAVRWFRPREDGSYLVEFELFTRLMPLDVMALRRAGVTDVLLPDKIWV
jgi:hypothetical protein